MGGVIIPQKQPGISQTLVPLAGTAAGAYFGGPGGAAAGGAIGGKLVAGGPQVQPVQPSAIDRRIGNLQQDPSMQLAQADSALTQLPPEYQQAYGPSIKKARELDMASRGNV